MRLASWCVWVRIPAPAEILLGLHLQKSARSSGEENYNKWMWIEAWYLKNKTPGGDSNPQILNLLF